MAYSDFTLESAIDELSLTLQAGALFPGIEPVDPPPWLLDTLARGQGMPLTTEKARSERIVVPILLAVRELTPPPLSIFSGHNLSADRERGLVGECDFILARTHPFPLLRSPVVTIVEAKKADIDLGMGQCVAQMVGAQIFNENQKQSAAEIYGCVTTGEDWQFLRLVEAQLHIDDDRYYLNNLGAILAVFLTMVREKA